ncbi:hypothetical protein MRX96_003662 [Rhipicephalus microplus]
MMKRPRCGVPDVIGHAERVRRYALQGSKWDKTDLTWSVEDFPRQADRGMIRSAIGKALKVWSDASKLPLHRDRRRVEPPPQARRRRRRRSRHRGVVREARPRRRLLVRRAGHRPGARLLSRRRQGRGRALRRRRELDHRHAQQGVQ